MNRRGITLYICLFSLLLCFTASAQDSTPQIAFLSDRDGNQEIYLMEADGSRQTNLTNFSGDDAEPAWSPDGTTIVFSRNLSADTWNVFAQRVDAPESQQLSDGSLDGAPVWSPDGTQIAFETSPVLAPHISILNVDGSSRIDLIDVEGDNNGNSSSRPNWSPDGTQIVFAAARDGAELLDIYVMNADGTGEKALTSTPDNETRPVWSPDGQWIAFMARKDSSDDYEIFVISTDGSNLLQLTDNDVFDGDIAWSPDSTKIAFNSVRDGSPQVYVIEVNGANERNLTQTSGFDAFPSWSPDGTQIAFVSDRDGNQEIYVMNEDGSEQTNLTNNPANDFSPIWQPVAAGIAAVPLVESETVASVPAEDESSAAASGLQVINAGNGAQLFELQVIDPFDFDPNESVYADALDANAEWIHAMVILGPTGLGGAIYTPDYGMAAVPLTQSVKVVTDTSARHLTEASKDLVSEYRDLSAAAISPDGSTAAGGDTYGGALLWNVNSGAELAGWQAHSDYLNTMLFTPDGSLLITIGNDGSEGAIGLWNPATGEAVDRISASDTIATGSFNADGSLLATGDSDSVTVWDFANKQPIREMPVDGGTVWSIAFNPEGTLLAAGTETGTIYLWDVASGNLVATLTGTLPETEYLRTIVFISFSPDSRLLLASADLLQLWGTTAEGGVLQVQPEVTEAAAEPPTEAPAATAVTAAATCPVTAKNNANLRGGPGTNFDQAGNIAAGETATADGQTHAVDGYIWYRLSTGAWVRGDLVTIAAECSDLTEVSS